MNTTLGNIQSLSKAKASHLITVLDDPKNSGLWNENTNRLMSIEGKATRVLAFQRSYAGNGLKALRRQEKNYDPALNDLLSAMGCDPSDEFKIGVQQSTIASNAIGSMVEFFIAEVLEADSSTDWFHARGGIIESIDFLELSTLNALQTKNSKTSQNSGGKKMMGQIKAVTWARRNNNTGKTYWDELLDGRYINQLNEQNFQKWNKEKAKILYGN